MQQGVNYPKGLIAWGKEYGLPTVLAGLEFLFEEYGDDRYRPNPLLRKTARRSKCHAYILEKRK